MTLLFTNNKRYLLGLTSLLLWVSLSSDLSIASFDTGRFSTETIELTRHPIVNWLTQLVNSNTPGAASPNLRAMGAVDNSSSSGHWPVRLPIVGQNGQGLSPIPSVTGFDQIYLSHCNERVAESGATTQTNY